MAVSILQKTLGYGVVQWIPGSEQTVAATLLTYAATDTAAGLGQDDAVQLASGLASLRTVCSTPLGGGKFALYASDGRLLGTRVATQADLEEAYRRERMPVPIVGDNPLTRPPVGAGDAADWGPTVALAIDRVLGKVNQARTAGSAQGAQVTPALALPVMVLIVGGAALSIIASVAAWRYLDPELRGEVAAVTAAADAYRARLDIYSQTGQMPPTSDVERSVADQIRGLAKERRNNRWAVTAGVVGGTVVGAVGLAALRRALV